MPDRLSHEAVMHDSSCHESIISGSFSGTFIVNHSAKLQPNLPMLLNKVDPYLVRCLEPFERLNLTAG